MLTDNPTSTAPVAAPVAAPAAVLLTNLHARSADIDTLWERCNNTWTYEDLIYRFWHQSFKVYDLQELTEEIVTLLDDLAPEGTTQHPWFTGIIAAGTGRVFEQVHNEAWAAHTRPIVEAFFHARFMLDMTHRYKSLEAVPQVLPSGWAALLYLYDIR